MQEAWQTKSDGGEDDDGELQEAQLSVSTAEKEWNQQSGLWATLLQVVKVAARHIFHTNQNGVHSKSVKTCSCNSRTMHPSKPVKFTFPAAEGSMLEAVTWYSKKTSCICWHNHL